MSYLLLVAMALTVVAILGSYSRGGYIGLAVLVAVAWLRTGSKMLYVLLVAVVLVPALHFMPDLFYERLSSISDYQSDGSFLARLTAWQVAYLYALDHFPFGAGFYGPQLPQVFSIYFPNVESHAAHSAYFQVLGEQGFIGLAIYLVILISALWRCSHIIGLARKKPELNWATELAKMTQLSLFVFCISGAALSMAYYDILVLAVSWLLPLTQLVAPQKIAERAPLVSTPAE
jgi:probable O-glycosylation ligase (exosortase A-associated)